MNCPVTALMLFHLFRLKSAAAQSRSVLFPIARTINSGGSGPLFYRQGVPGQGGMRPLAEEVEELVSPHPLLRAASVTGYHIPLSFSH
jgi:hypothetical protein